MLIWSLSLTHCQDSTIKNYFWSTARLQTDVIQVYFWLQVQLLTLPVSELQEVSAPFSAFCQNVIIIHQSERGIHLMIVCRPIGAAHSLCSTNQRPGMLIAVEIKPDCNMTHAQTITKCRLCSIWWFQSVPRHPEIQMVYRCLEVKNIILRAMQF